MNFYTDLYKDELLYSSIARFKYYDHCNTSKGVLKEVLGDCNSIPSLYIGSHIDDFITNIGGVYSAEQLIHEHTIYPYYEVFLPSRRQEDIVHIIKSDNGQGLYTMIGAVAGGICKKKGIYYCPKCVKEDEMTYGECYIHREHQLEGVLLCPHHGTYLKKYKWDQSNSSRIEFIRLNSQHIEKDESVVNISESVQACLLKLSQMAYELLRLTKHSNQEEVINKYKKILMQKGFININGRIKQNELYEAFTKFYDRKLLQLVESDIDNNYEYNWLRVITRNSKRTVHPLRHLLFINFLGLTVEEFFQNEVKDFNPFGKGP